MIKLGLVLFILFIFSACGRNDDYLAARIMSVFRVDGIGVTVTQPAGPVTAAVPGVRLSEGNAVATSIASFCFITLDNDMLVKMDENTRISVTGLTERLLAINVESGRVLADVQNQAPGHLLETRIGTVTAGVRGTLFTAGHGIAGIEAVITVLSGAVDVNDVVLEAGYTMVVHDGVLMIYDIIPARLDDLDEFTRNAAIDNHTRVPESVFVGHEDLLAQLPPPEPPAWADPGRRGSGYTINPATGLPSGRFVRADGLTGIFVMYPWIEFEGSQMRVPFAMGLGGAAITYDVIAGDGSFTILHEGITMPWQLVIYSADSVGFDYGMTGNFTEFVREGITPSPPDVSIPSGRFVRADGLTGVLAGHPWLEFYGNQITIPLMGGIGGMSSTSAYTVNGENITFRLDGVSITWRVMVADTNNISVDFGVGIFVDFVRE